jgi:hypothetical protein
MKTLQEAKPNWQRGGIAVVCEKCTKERYVEDFPKHAGDERLDIKSYLKKRLKAEGRWGPIRVVTSSCLDICARGTVTVLIDGLSASAKPPRCVVVDPLHGREELYAAIVDALTPPAVDEPVPATLGSTTVD